MTSTLQLECEQQGDGGQEGVGLGRSGHGRRRRPMRGQEAETSANKGDERGGADLHKEHRDRSEKKTREESGREKWDRLAAVEVAD
ncbi:hypothetical protein VZT92_010652 [Zoarces viviparus]|uniref:Uncharacterized protein n=1 Tax=Zoarces viviparus TaxID=48416 RepID=A0AAW1F9A5_ZOAVI